MGVGVGENRQAVLRSAFHALACRFYRKQWAARRGWGTATEVGDPIIKPIRYHML